MVGSDRLGCLGNSDPGAHDWGEEDADDGDDARDNVTSNPLVVLAGCLCRPLLSLRGPVNHFQGLNADPPRPFA